jgi:hypothetical protein
MSDNHESGASVKSDESPDSQFLWGADQIGAPINRNPRQTHYMLVKGEIRCAQKKGGRWVANRAALLREFGA